MQSVVLARIVVTFTMQWRGKLDNWEGGGGAMFSYEKTCALRIDLHMAFLMEGIGTKSRTKNFRKGRIVYAIRPKFALSKQLAASLLITSLDDQLATSLLATCNRPCDNANAS